MDRVRRAGVHAGTADHLSSDLGAPSERVTVERHEESGRRRAGRACACGRGGATPWIGNRRERAELSRSGRTGSSGAPEGTKLPCVSMTNETRAIFTCCRAVHSPAHSSTDTTGSEPTRAAPNTYFSRSALSLSLRRARHYLCPVRHPRTASPRCSYPPLEDSNVAR